MSLEACAKLVSRGDPDRFLAAMSVPPDVRARLLPLYAFNLELARAPWVAREPLVARMRLQFWHDVLDEIADGKPARAHEVATPLAEVIAETGLPVAVLHQMVEARVTDIDRDPFADAAALNAYLDATTGTLIWASVLALGGRDALEVPARAVGLGSGLANWLLAAPELMRRGWQALPPDLTDLVGDARVGLGEARQVHFGEALPALRCAWRAPGILARAADDPAAIHEGRLEESELSRRGTLLMKSLMGRW